MRTRYLHRALWRMCASGSAAGAIVAASAVMQPALAHHVMGGKTPSNFIEGLLSGFGHPIIGFDHLAFVVAVGLLSLTCARRFLMPLAFVALTAVGTLIHLAAVSLPMVEIVVAATVLVGGAMLISGRRFGWATSAGLFAVAGLFHGFAYGESIFGAEPTPVVAYLLGFVAIQYLIAVAAMEAVRRIARSGVAEQMIATRVTGGVVAGMAIVILGGQLMPF